MINSSAEVLGRTGFSLETFRVLGGALIDAQNMPLLHLQLESALSKILSKKFNVVSSLISRLSATLTVTFRVAR